VVALGDAHRLQIRLYCTDLLGGAPAKANRDSLPPFHNDQYPLHNDQYPPENYRLRDSRRIGRLPAFGKLAVSPERRRCTWTPLRTKRTA
jgi:hypothetical protein